jgi:hypothetical protein
MRTWGYQFDFYLSSMIRLTTAGLGSGRKLDSEGVTLTQSHGTARLKSIISGTLSCPYRTSRQSIAIRFQSFSNLYTLLTDVVVF